MIVFPATDRSQGCRGREVLADEGSRAREQSPGPGVPPAGTALLSLSLAMDF